MVVLLLLLVFWNAPNTYVDARMSAIHEPSKMAFSFSSSIQIGDDDDDDDD